MIKKSALIMLLILFSFFCSKSQKDISHHIFLLNKIGSVEVVKTPDLKKMKLKTTIKRLIQKRNSDICLPPSPLIKKIKCLTETRNALFAPADSIYDFSLKIGKDAKLKFGFAIDDIYLNLRRVPIEFIVQIKKKEEKEFQLLFKERIFPGSPVSMGWHDKNIQLKNYKGDVILRFVTKRHLEDTRLWDHYFAYWSNLVVVNPMDKNGAPKKPKVILISLDTLRADHFDILYNYKRETSPEIVRHSKDFVVFRNCWSQWCWTIESHHSIMTGLYEVEHKVPEFYSATPGHLVTLAEMMRSNGYMTAAFTGAGQVGAHTGLCKGFDTYFDNEYRNRGGFELLGTWLRAKQWLKENAKNDFFLFFHTYEIHAPYRTYIPSYDNMFKTYEGDNRFIFDVRREPIGEGLDKVIWYWKKKEGKITGADNDVIQGYKDYYDGSIRYTNDYFLRELISLLKFLKIYEDTIIVILSDHGEEFFEHGRFKHFDGLYEEYICVPLIFKFPNSLYGGRILEDNVETIDVFPTLLEVLGIRLKHRVSGKSLMNLIREGNKKTSRIERKYVFSQSSAKFCVKRDKIKLLLRSRIDHKLRGKINRIEIYDLKKDPKEQHAVKIDDLSDHIDLYESVYKKIIRKKRGIHIVFPGNLKGKNLEGKIEIPGGSNEIKRFFEIGVTKEDFTRFRERNKQIVFRWKMSGWKKSLILSSRKNKLKIRLKLKIDGKDCQYTDFILDKSLEREGEYIKLSKKSYKPTAGDVEQGIFLFGNGVVKKVKTGKYFPEISDKNLEKLKALGYIH